MVRLFVASFVTRSWSDCLLAFVRPGSVGVVWLQHGDTQEVLQRGSQSNSPEAFPESPEKRTHQKTKDATVHSRNSNPTKDAKISQSDESIWHRGADKQMQVLPMSAGARPWKERDGQANGAICRGCFNIMAKWRITNEASWEPRRGEILAAQGLASAPVTRIVATDAQKDAAADVQHQ